MRVVREPDAAGRRARDRRVRGAQGVRRCERLPREVRRAAAPRRDPGAGRSTSAPSHLGERECSIQRRHQKLVEEAPSVAVTAQLRERMGAAAVAAAKAVGYRGAGTCEFLLAPDGSFYFLEMNTRIQVEHPVTELVYGVDLVREQLRIAAGTPDAAPRRRARPAGLGDRVPHHQRGSGQRISAFAPDGSSTCGRPSGPGVRWDGGFETGNEVTLFYDSLLGKLIVWGPDRAEAIDRMRRALESWWSSAWPPTSPFTCGSSADPSLPGRRHRHPVPRPADRSHAGERRTGPADRLRGGGGVGGRGRTSVAEAHTR